MISVEGGDDGRPSVSEIKNYSCFVTKSTSHPAVTTLNGGEYAFGNTEERLKWIVLGTRVYRRWDGSTIPTAPATSPGT